MDFKMVELMDRYIASVAVCPVFIVHLNYILRNVIFKVAWTLLFYSWLKHSDFIHCVAAPRKNSHWKWREWQTWPVGLQLREIVCCIYGLEFVWLNGVKAVYGIPRCHWQETQCRTNGVCVAAVPTNAHPPPALRLALGPCSHKSVWKRSPFEYLFSPFRKLMRNELTYFWSVLFTPLDAYSSFLISRNVYFIVLWRAKM